MPTQRLIGQPDWPEALNGVTPAAFSLAASARSG